MGELNPNFDGCTRMLPGAALTSRLQAFETEMLSEEENFAGLTRLNRALIGRAEAIDSLYRAVPEMDSTEIPVYGEPEQCRFQRAFRVYLLSPAAAVQSRRRLPGGEAAPGQTSTAAPQNGQNEPHYHPKGASATCG
jgi:hypothetical protein